MAARPRFPRSSALTQSQAERLLADHGLVLDQGDRYFSSDVPPGRVMSQVPRPDSRCGVAGMCAWPRAWVRSGSSFPISSATASGLPRSTFAVAGWSWAASRMPIIPNAPPDQIIAQSPPANAVNVSEPKISLLMAAPPDPDSFVMPDLVGRSEDDAINEIVNAGLHVPTINTQAQPAGVPPATPSATRMVVKTVPAAGQRIFEGQPIALEVTP